MSGEYDFPDKLYVRVVEGVPGSAKKIKVEIYESVEAGEPLLEYHMKRVGFLWLREDERTLESLARRLKDKHTWNWCLVI